MVRGHCHQHLWAQFCDSNNDNYFFPINIIVCFNSNVCEFYMCVCMCVVQILWCVRSCGLSLRNWLWSSVECSPISVHVHVFLMCQFSSTVVFANTSTTVPCLCGSIEVIGQWFAPHTVEKTTSLDKCTIWHHILSVIVAMVSISMLQNPIHICHYFTCISECVCTTISPINLHTAMHSWTSLSTFFALLNAFAKICSIVRCHWGCDPLTTATLQLIVRPLKAITLMHRCHLYRGPLSVII